MRCQFVLILLLFHQQHQNCLSAKLTGITPRKPYQTRALPSTALFSSPNMPNMARLESLDVKCGRTGMNVELKFTSTFPGVVYSKGHFSDPSCMYVKPRDPRSHTFRFTIPIDGCGTIAEEDEGVGVRGQDGSGGRSVGNTIILQSDPLIQEVWDEARHITCTWSHSLTKSVAFLPFKVYEPETVDVELDKRSVNTLMEIQKGAGGPLHAPPTGYVHVGDDISVVMYVRGSKQDANVVSCNATTASRTAMVPLVDSRGCLLRPDLLTPFAKTRQTNGVDADLMLYSYLKAFNIAESPEFVISCELEVCDEACPDPCLGGTHTTDHGQRRRRKRHQGEEEEEEEVLLSSSSYFRRKRQEEEEEEEETLFSSSFVKGKVRLEGSVLVMEKKAEHAKCLFQSATALLSLALLMTLVSSLAVLSAVLGHKLWALKAQMRGKSGY